MEFQGNFSQISLDEIIERRAEQNRPTIMYVRGWYVELHHEVFLRVFTPERDHMWDIDWNRGNPVISSEMDI